MIAGRAIIRRVNIVAARLARDAFTAAKAVAAPEIPDWLREFFEIEIDPNNPLDLSNPDRDLVLGASDGADYDTDYSASGPCLDLG